MRAEGIFQAYGERTVFENFFFEAEEGKITAVLGGSGAGKTTLLNILAGATPYRGQVEGVGRIARVFQSPMLLPNLSVEENLKFALPKEEWGNIRASLKQVGLEGREGDLASKLSGGEAQRVALCRAICYPHDTLLLDEPFSSLDLALKRSLISLFVGLWRERKSTVIFVTHDVHEAALLAEKAVVLKEGKLVGETEISSPYPRDFLVHGEVEERLTRLLLGE